MSIYLRDFGNRPACLCDRTTVVSLMFVLLLSSYPLHAEDQSHRAQEVTAAVAKPQLTLTISPTNIEFGNVTVNTSSTRTVRLTSTGTAPVTIKSGKLSGSSFKMSGATFPVTLKPDLALTVDIKFHPSVTGTATGQLTLESNSSVNSKMVIDLTGKGESAHHQVELKWDKPGDSDIAIVGYDIYRAVSSSSTYHRLNSSLEVHTTYVDTTVQTGVTYNYIVKSVDPFGVESAPSNKAGADVP